MGFLSQCITSKLNNNMLFFITFFRLSWKCFISASHFRIFSFRCTCVLDLEELTWRSFIKCIFQFLWGVTTRSTSGSSQAFDIALAWIFNAGFSVMHRCANIGFTNLTHWRKMEIKTSGRWYLNGKIWSRN